jgi:hypothetical protein
MKMTDIAFTTTDWNAIAPEQHPGETGFSLWRTGFFGPKDNAIRVRMVEYSPGYLADHWCDKGHLLFCLEGTLDTELEDGRFFHLSPGMSYQVADGVDRHRSRTSDGAKLLIVD